MRGLFRGVAILAAFLPKHPIVQSRQPATFTALIITIAALNASSPLHAQEIQNEEAAQRVGKRLFHDLRLSNPGARFDASCRSCHIPPGSPEAERNYADILPRSLLPSSGRGDKLTAYRNTPTLINAADRPAFHWDGRYTDLKQAIIGEFSSIHLGWLPTEREYALDEIWNMIIWDQGEQDLASGPYNEEFQTAYGIDIEALDREQSINLVATALADYIRTLREDFNTPYDKFIAANNLPETPVDLLQKIEAAKSGGDLTLPEAFTPEALSGLKIFLRTEGPNNAGACVTCHPPPAFTDNKFHNTGVAKQDYDNIHGKGAFQKLEIPDPSQRPIPNLAKPPIQDDPTRADLGHWNHAPPETANQHKAAFRTPTLRGLVLSNPYMHNGAYATLRDVIAGGHAGMHALTPPDVEFLIAFLNSLN